MISNCWATAPLPVAIIVTTMCKNSKLKLMLFRLESCLTAYFNLDRERERGKNEMVKYEHHQLAQISDLIFSMISFRTSILNHNNRHIFYRKKMVCVTNNDVTNPASCKIFHISYIKFLVSVTLDTKLQHFYNIAATQLTYINYALRVCKYKNTSRTGKERCSLVTHTVADAFQIFFIHYFLYHL